MKLKLVTDFLQSRREGIAPTTLRFYRAFLTNASPVIGLDVTGNEINDFLKSLNCQSGGKHAYYRALRAFYNWVYSPRSPYGLNPQDNPIHIVDSPKVERKILPSLTQSQLEYVIEQAECLRDKAIIGLFADSGLRRRELASIRWIDINWDNRTIKVRCKGNKDGLAAFGTRTETLLEEWRAVCPQTGGMVWDLNQNGIATMLRRLKARTNLPCNPHTFRRTFASILAKRGVDSLHIMRLGRWESIQMVERYTRSVRFEDSLKLYSAIMD